jgi:GntR family transcriptional regulator
MSGATTNADALNAVLRRAMTGEADQGALYLRLAAALSDAIDAGLLADGAPMPSERSLTEALGLSRVTVRAALERLVERGLVLRRQGARSVVRNRLVKTPELASFTEEMQARGRVASNLWIDRSLAPADLFESMALGLEPGALVARLTRVRLADGLAVAIEDAAVPASILPDPEAVEASLYALLRARGYVSHHGFQRVRAVLATEADAERLGLPPGAPILAFERRTFLADGRALEVTRTRYSGAAYEFVMQLSAESNTTKIPVRMP